MVFCVSGHKSQAAEVFDEFLDDPIWGGGPGGDAGDVFTLDVAGFEFLPAFEVVAIFLVSAAELGQFAGIGAVPRAEDEHDVHLGAEFDGRGLPAGGFTADGVDDFHLVVSVDSDESEESAEIFGGVGGLGNNGESTGGGQFVEIVLVGKDDDIGGIADDALDFRVMGVSDDDDLVVLLVEFADEFLGAFDEDAGCVGDFEASGFYLVDEAGSAAVAADKDGSGRGVEAWVVGGDFVEAIDDLESFVGKFFDDLVVVDEMAEAVDGFFLFEQFFGKGDGLFDAEAESKFFSDTYLHG